MKICILDNDDLDPSIAPVYQSYGAMCVRLLNEAGAHWSFDIFHTPSGDYPPSFDAYAAVLLTGSKADSFSDDAWVVELRARVSALLAAKKKLLGICFGHQLIALCMGARVGRAPQGWGVGRTAYDWHSTALPAPRPNRQLALLASHQDQVLELPQSATLLASNSHCPVAAYTVDDTVFCVQGHPEFVPAYSAFLLERRRKTLGETQYTAALGSLQEAHDGLHIARLMVAFVEDRTGVAAPGMHRA